VTHGLPEVLVPGAGAIGSNIEAAIADLPVACTFVDRQAYSDENRGVALVSEADIGRPKAAVLAARRRARGRVARALHGDVRYTIRPGLARSLAATIVAVDSATALRDLAEAFWSPPAARGLFLVVTCGGESNGAGWQARAFVPPGLCATCLFGAAEREADRLAQRASCYDTTAPRAAAAAAEAAARGAAAILARWLGGERALAGCRIQRDAGGGEYVIRMPAAPSPGCPVPHPRPDDPLEPREDLGGSVAEVPVARLAERALALAGEQAEIDLGRRALPLGGLYCPCCRALSPAQPLLLPAAQAAARACSCGELPQPLGERHTVGARELLALGPLSLAAWGAAPGDEFSVVGRRRVRLTCRFDWGEIDDDQ
jgi:hypothetical protein